MVLAGLGPARCARPVGRSPAESPAWERPARPCPEPYEAVWDKFKGGLLTIGRRLTSAMAVIGEAAHLALTATRSRAPA